MTQPPDDMRREADPSVDALQPAYYVFLTIGLFCLCMVAQSFASTVLQTSGFYDWYYPHELVVAAFDKEHPDKVAQTRLQLWAVAGAVPLWLMPTFVVFRLLPDGYCRDIGVSLGRFARNDDSSGNRFARVFRALGIQMALGVAVGVLLTPVLLEVNQLVLHLYALTTESSAKDHPLTVAAQSGRLAPSEWWLLAVSVMVSAPVGEELLFRGLLPALGRSVRGNGGHALTTLALATAVMLRWDDLKKAPHEGFRPFLFAAMPVLFVVALLPCYALVCWRSRTENGPIIFGTAALFAAVHTFAWPTPVSLFFLGLALGCLAVWTRSLIAPMVVHAVFNAVSYAWLLFM